MMRNLEVLCQRIADLFRALNARPYSLFCVLFAANAAALPYMGIFHDAKIYGLLTLNRIDPDHFAGDLFFQYGSQDRYSLFSLAAAPLVAVLGLPVGFFLLYLLSNGLLLLAIQRFVRALIKDPLISIPTLLYLAITPIPFAGLSTFHVNEPFLTPRIEANALVLFALERLLAGRWIQTGLFIFVALLLHPLMAFPGLLVVGGWLILSFFQPKKIIVGAFLAAILAAAILLYKPIALRLFGSMDETWRQILDRVYFFVYPLKWTAQDWVRILLSFTVVFTNAWDLKNDVCIRRLLFLVSIVGAVGLAVGVLACFLPYALLLQGQSYRWLWLLALTSYPLSFQLVQQFWKSAQSPQRLAALGLVICLNASPWDNSLFLLFLTDAVLIGVVYWRGLAMQPRSRDWVVRAVLLAVTVVMPFWTTFKLGLVIALQRELRPLLEPLGFFGALTGMIDPLCRLAAVVLTVLLLRGVLGLDRGLRFASLAICSAAYLLFFVLPQSRFYSDHWTRFGRDRCFIADYLAQHPTPGKTPTIYWPCGRLEITWMELNTNSYFDLFQVAGMLFNSGTAWEAERRLQIVRKFEMQRYQQEKILYAEQAARRFHQVFQLSESEPLPDVKDLLTLCREKQLDLVVIAQEFPGWCAASTGNYFLYDCRTIRARLQQGSTPLQGVASMPPLNGNR